MSRPASCVNQYAAATAANGSSNSTRRRKTRVASNRIAGRRRDIAASVAAQAHGPTGDRVAGNPGQSGEFREQQSDSQRREQQHHSEAQRRQQQAGDVEVRDDPVAGGIREPIGQPAEQRREQRDADQLHAQVQRERLAPASAEVGANPTNQPVSHTVTSRIVAQRRR